MGITTTVPFVPSATLLMARNTYVAPGVEKLSRSKLYSKKGSYKRTYPDQAGASSENVAPGKSETKKLKNGSERVVPKGSARSQRYYAVDEVKAPKSGRKTKVSRPTKLRSSITPGTVLIPLAGRFRGRRVVCLKQLSSGLLLVTGPFKINGVPLKRVNQAYVIATSTKVDISAVEVDSKIDDAYFTKDKTSSRSGKEGEFFKDGEKENDAGIVEAVNKVDNLAAYLKASFGLTNGQYPTCSSSKAVREPSDFFRCE